MIEKTWPAIVKELQRRNTGTLLELEDEIGNVVSSGTLSRVLRGMGASYESKKKIARGLGYKLHERPSWKKRRWLRKRLREDFDITMEEAARRYYIERLRKDSNLSVQESARRYYIETLVRLAKMDVVG